MDKTFSDYIRSGLKEKEKTEGDGGFLIPSELQNIMIYIIHHRDRVNARIKYLVCNGRFSEALGLISIEIE